MSAWKDTTLGEFIALQRGHDLTDPERSIGIVPVMGSAGQNGFHNIALAKGPGIVIGRSGASFGQIHYCPVDYWPHNTALYVTDFKGNDVCFAYYFLKTLDFSGYNSGSAQPSLNRNYIYLASVKIPPLAEQRAIAEVLSSLDDKIDLLHRQNKTLETLAETLFRQSFIEQAQPDWKEGSLLELIELVGGGTPQTSKPEYWDGNIPWLSGGDIASNHKSFVLKSEKNITQIGLDHSAAKLLPKYATVISARGTVGKYCLLEKEMVFSQSNYGILPKVEGCYFFTNLLINHIVEELQAAAYGSVFDTITTATFRDAKLPIPSQLAIREFENEIKPYFDKQLLNKHQIQTLETLRDTLLPKLMSGEIRVACE